jgi:hypothetical protein
VVALIGLLVLLSSSTGAVTNETVPSVTSSFIEGWMLVLSGMKTLARHRRTIEAE